MKKYCEEIFQASRFKTREVKVGTVGVGGDNPVRIQSMTTSSTRDVAATIDQVMRLADAGCEIARVTVQGMKEADSCEAIKDGLLKKGYSIPLVADIHFYPPAAMRVVDFVDKVRVNPGNFVDKRATFKTIEYDDITYQEEIAKIQEGFSPLVEKCKKLKRAMRIGTNHGSLSDRIMNRYGDTPQGMVESALEFARVCRSLDYHDIIFSMKASNPLVMIQAYRLLVHEMIKLGWNYPLHLGVTEAGEGEDGRVKSAVGIGALLLDGLGDTIRVSLTEDPWHEIDTCKRLRSFSQQNKEGIAKLQFGAKSALFVQDTDSAQIAYSKSSMSICAETGPAQKSSNLASKASFVMPSEGKGTDPFIERHRPINLKTAVGSCKKVQDFDPEPLDAGVEHSQKVKATPASRGSGSKDCAFLPASTAVFRINEPLRRQVVLPSNSSLHRDGSVILSMTESDLLQEDFFNLIGCKMQLNRPVRTSATVDYLWIDALSQDPVIGKILKQLQELNIGILTNSTQVLHAIPVKKLSDIRKNPTLSDFAVIISNENQEDWELLKKHHPTFILLALKGSRLHYCRLFFEWLKENALSIPVILNFQYDIPWEDCLIHSAAECGALLGDGLGEGICLSGPYGSAALRLLSFNILQAARMRTSKTEFISCPGCGRTLFELQKVTKRIRERTSHLPGVKIAIMGCIVNGPGEMADADFGYVGSKAGKIDLYVGKTCVERDIDFAQADDRLVALIRAHGRWIEPEKSTV